MSEVLAPDPGRVELRVCKTLTTKDTKFTKDRHRLSYNPLLQKRNNRLLLFCRVDYACALRTRGRVNTRPEPVPIGSLLSRFFFVCFVIFVVILFLLSA